MPTFPESTEKRRLSVGMSLTMSGSSASLSRRTSVESSGSVPENDDQAEKLAALLAKKQESRRRSAAFARSATVEEAVANAEARKNTETVQLSNGQLTDLYSNCMKLCAENKITMKNSWGLRLIDYMDELVQKGVGGHGSETNFQVASCTLDAGVKIYSYRVDSVHNETYKILGGLSRGDGKEGAEDDGNSDDEGENQGEDSGVLAKTKSQKKYNQTGTNTLENNLDSINCKKFDIEFNVDPLFRKTSAAFDEGGAKGLLLNRLELNGGCELIFDSSESSKKVPVTAESFTDQSLRDLPGLYDIGLSLVKSCRELTLCPEFTQYMEYVGQYPSSGNAQKPVYMNTSLSKAAIQSSDFPTGDADHESLVPNEDQEHSDESEDEHQANFSGDDFEAPMHDGNRENRAHDQTQAIFNLCNPDSKHEQLDVGTLLGSPEGLPEVNQQILKNWAGPGQWKYINTLTTSEPRTKGKGDKKKKKSSFSIDFRSSFDGEEHFKASKRANLVLSEAALSKASLYATTLPRDIRYEPKNLTKLFTRESWVGSTAKIRTQEVEGGGWYDYNNPNDIDNFCPDMTGNYDSDGDAPGFSPDSRADEQEKNENELCLVDAPQRASKIEIGYATKAKQVDVKSVKESIWAELQANGKEAAKTSSTQPTHTFQDVVMNISDRLPETERQNASVSIYFICLLHLANEKGLSLQGSEGMDKLDIILPSNGSTQPNPCPLPRRGK